METARDTSEDEVIDFEESVNSHDDYEKARRKWIYLGDQLICDLILECFTLILSWPEFKASTNRDILIKIIHPLSQRGRQDASSCQTVNQHIENAVRYLETVSVSDDPMSQMELEADSSCAVKLKSPTTAYHIFKICLLLKSLDDSDETRGIIHNMAKKYILMSGWFKPSQLELMYDQEILLHDTPLEHLYELVQNLSVNDKNHFRHWKIYLKNLPDIMKTVFTDVTSDDTMRTRLLKLGEIFNRLIQQTKELSQGSKSAKVLEEKYYPMAMRYGKAVLRSFSNDGIATVTQLLRRHKAAVRDVLRNWQVANRQLIAIRSYFFKRRNNQHRQLLIDLGKQQDQLFYTLCHIAKSIGVSLAMTIGTLKHKAPNGEQIASQIGRQESSDEESEEEEDDGINLPSIDEEEEGEENDQDDDPSNGSEHPVEDEEEEGEEEEEEDLRIRKRPKTKKSNKFMKSTQLSDHDFPPFESIDEFTFDAVDNEIEETHSFMDSDGEIVDEGVSCEEDENGEDLMESDNDSTASF
ncbi:hypothetical protein BKA69DRAFT_1096389 [Paraphysoderma sedebokerense]|nr:hypothetical protein BKA69DRAFT_1096389 [Paraphysoderma sedebokerense]